MADPRETIVDVRNLSVDFSVAGNAVHAVKSVSFDIKRGETVALVGESGSGKSVTALSITRLLPYPSASHPTGEILFKGDDVLTMKEADIRRIRGADIGMIFQEPMTSLNPLHLVEKQVGEVLKLHQGMSNGAARARTIDLLTKAGINDAEAKMASYRISFPAASASA